MIPGCSRNWRRTSRTTVPADRPTARMASAENRNGTEPPMSIPMNVLGSGTLIWVSGWGNTAEDHPEKLLGVGDVDLGGRVAEHRRADLGDVQLRADRLDEAGEQRHRG